MIFQAIQALKQYQSAATRKALTDILENEQCFYKVRIEASMCLAKVGLELLCLSFSVVIKHDFHPAFSHIFIMDVEKVGGSAVPKMLRLPYRYQSFFFRRY